MWIIEPYYRNKFISNFANNGRYKYFEQYTKRKISKLEDIKKCCYEVYDHGVPFQSAKQKYKIGDYRKVLDSLARKLYVYFNDTLLDTYKYVTNNQENFDTFHDELCMNFLVDINANRNTLGYPPFTYGNAQKLINMVFKYLSCYGDYPEYADLFSYCHMPIDGNILNVFEVVYQMPNVFRKKYKGIPWTSFTKELYYDLVYRYRDTLESVKYDNCYLAIDYVFWDEDYLSNAGIPYYGKNTIPIKKFRKA